MQVEALHEQISDHMRREERAAQEKAERLGRETQRSSWSAGSAHVLQQRCSSFAVAVSALRDTTGYEMVQEALKAETEFHIQMFERIREDYRAEAVCCGTWIPAWAAALRETVHMYEVSPVHVDRNEAIDQFPESVFDMLDDTRKREQGEREIGDCPKIEREVVRTTSQEWYAGRFARRKRGDASKAEAEVGVSDASDDEPIFECEHDCGFESPDQQLVEEHERVCKASSKVAASVAAAAALEQICAVSMGIDERVSDEPIFECEHDCGFESPDQQLVEEHERVCKASSKVAADVAAAATLEQIRAATLEQIRAVSTRDDPRRRECVNNQQEATRARWKTDTNAKLSEVGAGLLRVMCITDQMKAEGENTVAAVEASLSDETKGILRERAGRLRKRKYGTYDYGAMLEWLQNTQRNDGNMNWYLRMSECNPCIST